MKKNIFALLLFVMATGFMFSSCSKDDDDDSGDNNPPTATNELSFVVNGGPYSNQTFTFKQTANAIYDPAMNATGCSFEDAAGNAAMVAFNGNTTGTYTVTDDNGLAAFLNNNTTIMGLTSGSIVVTTYGTVGNVVAGTFSGMGVVSTNFGAPDTITFSNGKFRAARIAK